MTYEYQQEQGLLTLQGKKQTVTGKVLKCYDLENSRPTICFTGLTQDGEAGLGQAAAGISKYPNKERYSSGRDSAPTAGVFCVNGMVV